ncbi:uncharacterized protein MELLADRAFT_87586 [Melampsora larici-populina 98AG31]|uniref:Uncharacterized protein n=1 Tax=Melampsora larici-populina (strain 98AG31 / pathotype 3-4-7) TaxID=747676 RepID=F4RNZ3_MELLP|nr:uncharacterized protein MELLADRAFT_87586 [Melampsora larici-populina 98AG31]EGG05944.1 hypothetical protein MELLADRAFT_87586 [Melampsora larici-populina 98AG31]
MFQDVVKMGFNMDQSVANFASNSSEIQKGTDTVKGLIPTVLKAQDELYKSTKLSNATQDEEVKKAMTVAKASGEVLIKALDAIAASPEDANVIKTNYKAMAEAFEKIIDGSERLAEAADPTPQLNEEGILPQSANPDGIEAGKESNSGKKSDEKQAPTSRGEVLETGKTDVEQSSTPEEKLAESTKGDVEQSDTKLTGQSDVSATRSKEEVTAALDEASRG